jgi:hypothetical protein
MIIDFLFICFILIGVAFIVMLFISQDWENYLEAGNNWEALAKKGEGYAESLFADDQGPSDPTHRMRVRFIRGWNEDVIRWRGLAEKQYNKVPKWYLKLRSKI